MSLSAIQKEVHRSEQDAKPEHNKQREKGFCFLTKTLAPAIYTYTPKNGLCQDETSLRPPSPPSHESGVLVVRISHGQG